MRSSNNNNNYNYSKVAEFPSIFSMYYPVGDTTTTVPSLFVSKYYAGEDYNSIENNENDDDDHTEEDEVHARNMAMLDLVVHVEEIQSQLEEVMGMHQKFRELNEGWLESNSRLANNNQDRVSWIITESKKRKALDKMGKSFEQIQDEIAMLSLKSKDLYREHSRQQLNRQHQRIRRSIQEQQKKLQKQQQKYFNTTATGSILRSIPEGLPPRPRPRPFAMRSRIQTQ